MAKIKKTKIILSEKAKTHLEQIDQELQQRGAKDYDLCEIIEELLVSRHSQTIIDQFVNKKTPESYKLSRLLDTPGEREKILELLQDKSFGMSGHNGSLEAQV